MSVREVQKTVTEKARLCDFCEEEAIFPNCYLCGKDMCLGHSHSYGFGDFCASCFNAGGPARDALKKEEERYKNEKTRYDDAIAAIYEAWRAMARDGVEFDEALKVARSESAGGALCHGGE
jgi:hypothetical protein